MRMLRLWSQKIALQATILRQRFILRIHIIRKASGYKKYVIPDSLYWNIGSKDGKPAGRYANLPAGFYIEYPCGLTECISLSVSVLHETMIHELVIADEHLFVRVPLDGMLDLVCDVAEGTCCTCAVADLNWSVRIFT